MKGSTLINKLMQILQPENEPDNWIEIRDLAYKGSLTEEVREEIVSKLGEYEHVLECDRPFGEEDTQRTVILFKDHNVYLAMDGYYDSWSGGNWDGAELYEVKPVTKTYTDWEKV